jgi:hypothetical protein
MADENIKTIPSDNIRKFNPENKGKSRTFTTDQNEKKSSRSSGKSKLGPSSSDVPKPRLQATNTNPTPQKNESLVSEAIFGVDVKVQAIEPRQSFLANYSRLPTIADEIFSQYAVDNNMLNRELDSREFRYYATALLWLRLLEVKSKQNRMSLTSQEKDIRKMCQETTFNVPQPLFVYLLQVGDVMDGMGKVTELEVPALPIAVAGGFGGYLTSEINVGSHALFEEIPSLGMMGDAIMTIAGRDENPNMPIRVAIPRGACATQNLLGYIQDPGPRRIEIRQRLAGHGISAFAFPESVQNTRFNLCYLKQISDTIGKQQTYNIEKVVFPNLTKSGGETQIIMTRPIEEEDLEMTWIRKTVQATSATCEATAQMGAACVFGFQLYKENGPGATIAEQTLNWSCLTPIPPTPNIAPWVIPEAWRTHRNDRRNLPPGIGTERFRSLSQKQSDITFNVIRRMIKTSR